MVFVFTQALSLVLFVDCILDFKFRRLHFDKFNMLKRVVFLMIISSIVKAEYRAYVLQIKDRSNNRVTLIEHSLDPNQYKTVYGISSTQEITYIDTWLCPGRTNLNTQICNKPDRPKTGPDESRL